MKLNWVFTGVMLVILVFLIVYMEIRDKRILREEESFKRAIRVYGTVTDFGLAESKYKRSQRFFVLYEMDGKRYTAG